MPSIYRILLRRLVFRVECVDPDAGPQPQCTLPAGDPGPPHRVSTQLAARAKCERSSSIGHFCGIKLGMPPAPDPPPSPELLGSKYRFVGVCPGPGVFLGAFGPYDWTGTELVLATKLAAPYPPAHHKAEARQEVLEEGLSVG